MKYLPTVDIWSPSVSAALRFGQLKLQRGQWVRCGNDRPSRFVCVRPSRSIWAVHPDGSGRVSLSRFRALCAATA